MPKLSFDLNKVEKLFNELKTNPPTEDEATLHLVGDGGVYLINNADIKEPPSARDSVVYAKGYDPDLNDDWYDKKGNLFGYDDFVVDIPIKWFTLAKQKNKSRFTLNLTKHSISLVI